MTTSHRFPRLAFRALFTTLLAALVHPVWAQESDPELPVKKAPPILDRRGIGLPGKLPQLKAAPKPAPLLGQAPPPPVPDMGGSPVPAPPRPGTGDEEGGLGAGDIAKLAESSCRPLKPRDKLMFEFKDADIKDVVTAISKTMCKNFILTSKVRSQKFDIISPQKITVEEAWRAFLSALEANDFTLFQVGKYYKIIQANDGTRAPVPIYNDSESYPVNDRMVTKIWKLANGGDINAVVNYLNIFKSSRGQIHPFASTNTMVATDYSTSLERLERILDEIDAPGVTERVHVVTVDYASATAVAEKLTQVFEPAKAAAPGAPRPGAAARGGGTAQQVAGKRSGANVTVTQDAPAVSKILADERTNKLIIIASDASFKQIMALKRKLDIPSDVGEGQVHVLRLKHANAEELSQTLASLAQGKPTSGRPARVGGKAATPPGAPAAPVVPSAPGQAALFQGEIKVTADKPTNSLVITASKADFVAMKRVIAQLDVPRLQVFVEAVIMEVAMKRDTTVGLSEHGAVVPQVGGKDTPIVFGFEPTKDFNSLLLTSNPASLIGITGLAGAWRGFPAPGTEQIITGGIPAFGLVMQALQSNNDVNVVSTPNLLTMDNEEAEIQVSEKIPFSSGLSLGNLGGLASQFAGQAGAAGLTGAALGLGSVNIQREDVGLTLKLKPQINDQENVRLEIDQELSDVSGLDPTTGQTITSKRAAKTVVVVRDQDSVVIGGLVRDKDFASEGKVPLLGDIPVLGWLFKRRVTNKEKVNLILVLTPYIIRGPQDFWSIYQRKMEERKDFLLRYYGSTAEYRAAVDWDRKPGPVALYRQQLREELAKPENGGPGAEGDEVIKAGEKSENGETLEDGIELHREDNSSAAPGSPPPPPPVEMPPQIEPEFTP